MREIKFRLRDENNNIVGYERWSERGCRWEYSTDNKVWFLNYISHKYKDEFTGLNDKNGVEIYEGDKCKGIHGEQNKPDTKYEKIEIVYGVRGGFELFQRPLCSFSIDNDSNIMWIKWYHSRHMNVPEMFYEITDIEVIGNIHENPELLKD